MSFRVAVVGSGPAGYYAAAALLASDLEVEVDMIERLPTPWGLVRLGVAPDHPNIKAVSRAFERTAAQPGFRFFGNVEVGKDVEHAELARLYDAVVYSVGAQTDRQLGIPGEDLPGSWPATAFVAWYNGHPDFQDLSFDLSGERAVVIGNGNVALDVARMLALTPEELAPTDTTDAAIEAINGVRDPRDPRRRPPRAGAGGLDAGRGGRARRARGRRRDRRPGRPRARRGQRGRARGGARRPSAATSSTCATTRRASPTGKPRAIRLRFFSSPVAIHGDGKVEAIELVRNELVDGRAVRDRRSARRSRAGSSFGASATRACRSRACRSTSGAATIPNEGGRVEPGLYVAGWIKRGPSGVIGTNKKDATETVALLLDDARAGLLPARGEGTLEALLEERGVEAVLYAGWEAIDAAERDAGEPLGRPRVKLCSWDDLLAAAKTNVQHPPFRGRQNGRSGRQLGCGFAQG